MGCKESVFQLLELKTHLFTSFYLVEQRKLSVFPGYPAETRGDTKLEGIECQITYAQLAV
jgi:hypothetical protein